MNRFDKKVQAEGIEIDQRNGVPAHDRNLGSITKLINAARAAEAELVNKLGDLRDELSEERLVNQKLVSQLGELKMELAECRLRQKVTEGDFTQAQRVQLIGSAV